MTAPTHSVRVSAGAPPAGYWRAAWQHRELMWFLARRDLLVRYKDTALGAAWALFRPFLTTLIMVVVFHRLVGLSSGEVAYPLLVFTATLPWQLFASAVGEVGSSLLNNRHIIGRVYFPRIVLPVSAMAVALVDFCVTAALMGALLLWYGHAPGWPLLALPAFVALAFVVALGAGLWASALQIRYRDLRFVLPYVVQFGLYVSPVGFASQVVPEPYRLFYALNPLVGVIDGFRWCLLGQPIAWGSAAASALVAGAMLASGIRYFRRTERVVADIG